MHYELYKQQEDVPKEHPLAIYAGKQALPTSFLLLSTNYFSHLSNHS